MPTKLRYSWNVIRARPGDHRRVASAGVDCSFSARSPTNSDVSHFWRDVLGSISYRHFMDPAVNTSEYLFRYLLLCVPADNLWRYSKEISPEFPLDFYLRRINSKLKFNAETCTAVEYKKLKIQA